MCMGIEEEPEYGGRKYLEKQDYILAKQKEQLALQAEKLEELVMKIEDVENLIDEVSELGRCPIGRRIEKLGALSGTKSL